MKGLLLKNPLDGTLAEKQVAFNDMLRMYLICYSLCMPMIQSDANDSPLTKSELDAFENNLIDLKTQLQDEVAKSQSQTPAKTSSDNLVITDVTDVNQQKKKEALPEVAYMKQHLQAKSSHLTGEPSNKSAFGVCHHHYILIEVVFQTFFTTR